ncbi:tail protein X [Geminocystis sp. NIES-3709]|uniref:tail protein X n=1 Tax=Geminocystis sp. NIES-3709 TaxID=1617448 RepID=UPI0005FC7EB3|nr:tail protein X [Geminocystis sp. NIES-3709]BAQ65517.1 hypothetical protein GM3709_2282 [Geminocystis sp. NIES-3709]
MSQFFRYETKQGDRWDTVAVKYRNNPYDYVDIIQANPNYQGNFIIPEGIILSIPVRENITRRIIPPWER